MSPTCARVSLLTRTRFLATKKPGPDTLPPGVLSPFLFHFYFYYLVGTVSVRFCSNTPVLPKDGMNPLAPRAPLLPSVSTHGPQKPLSGAPAWNQHIPVCLSPPMLQSSAGADLHREGCEQHTDVGSCRNSQLHKCGPGIASMGYDSCLCSSDMIASTGPVPFLLLSFTL